MLGIIYEKNGNSLYFRYFNHFLFQFLTTEATTIKTTNQKVFKTTNTKPSNIELLILSHLVYFNIDTVRTTSGMSVKDLLYSKYYSSITAKFKDELSNDGLSLDQIEQESDLSKWFIYAFNRDEQDDFFGVIFKNTATGKFVVAFEGTNSLTSIYEDFLISYANEDSELINSANHLLDKLPKNIKSENVILTGHSLGGYLATRIGAVKNYKTVHLMHLDLIQFI